MANPIRARSLSLAAALVAALTLTACAGSRFGGGSTSPSVDASASASAQPSLAASQASGSSPSAPASAPASAEPTDNLGPFTCQFPIEQRGEPVHTQLVDVRVGEHDGFDRVVFEFDNGIPEYVLGAAEPPYTEDPSGLPIEVDGEAVLQLVMIGGTRVTQDYESSYDGPLEFQPGFDKLVHLVEAGDFEAVSSWYIGLSGDSCARVLDLDDPERLVIDIEH